MSPTDYTNRSIAAAAAAVLAPIIAAGAAIVGSLRQLSDLRVSLLIVYVAVLCCVHLMTAISAMRNSVLAAHPHPTEVQRDQFPDLIRRHFGPARCDYFMAAQTILLTLVPLLALLFDDPSLRWLALGVVPFLVLSGLSIRRGLKQPRPNH